jgi:Transposase, Mutator family
MRVAALYRALPQALSRSRPQGSARAAGGADPAGQWRKLRSTNPLERFNKEIGRRTDVVGIFPDDRSLIRLAGMLCIEQTISWLVGCGYLSAESISLVLAGQTIAQATRRWRSSKRPEPHHRHR